MNLSRIGIALSLTPAALQVWLALILKWRDLTDRFRLFSLYTWWSIVAQISLVLVGSLAGYRTFFLVYASELVVSALLGILAMEESLREVLGEYYQGKRGFKVFVPAMVLVALALSVWQWLRHPSARGPLLHAFISFTLASDYMLAAIFGLFVMLVLWRQVSWRQYRFGIMAGFGLISIVGMLADLLRSDFGTKWNLFFSYAPSVAYIAGCLIWLAAFIKPEPRNRFTGSGEPADVDEVWSFLRKLRKEVK